jgi:hypothetical protein
MKQLFHAACTRYLTAAILMTLFFITPAPKSAAAFTLTVSNSKAGSGSINGAVTCNIGPAGGCNATSLSGPVTLSANPDWKSVFDGWGLPCSGTGSCGFTLTADTNVPADFSLNFQALIVGHSVNPTYATLTDAYAAANSGSVIAANVYTFHEDLILNAPKQIGFALGKPDGGPYYLGAVGFTTLLGSLTIQQGVYEVDSLIIQ